MRDRTCRRRCGTLLAVPRPANTQALDSFGTTAKELLTHKQSPVARGVGGGGAHGSAFMPARRRRPSRSHGGILVLCW